MRPVESSAYIILILCLLRETQTYELTLQALTRSILHHGDPAMFTPLLQKLLNQECIRIGFVGGSVSAGRGLPKGAQAYPGLFEQLINEAFPCKGAHTIVPYIKGSTASDHWIDFFAGRQEELLRRLDLIIVDTAVNDIYKLLKGPSGQSASPDVVIREHTELLMLLMLQKSRRLPGWSDADPQCTAAVSPPYKRAWTGAAVLWLGASTRRTEIWRGPLPRSTDAVHAQLPVAIAHGVPYISLIDGLGPFTTPASVEWLNRTWYSEPVSDIHPGAWGHQALAKALLHFLTEQVRFQQQLPWADPRANPQPLYEPYCSRPPAFVAQTSLDVYLDSSPLYIPTLSRMATSPRLKNCVGWKMMADVPGRPGLIAEAVGSKCTIVARPHEFQRRDIKVGEAHVMLLRSYEHMGRLRVTVATVPAVVKAAGSNKTDCVLGGDAMSVLGGDEIDTLWDERVSEPKAAVVRFKAPRTMADTCLTFTLEVVPSGRRENKVKLVGLTVF